MALASDAPVLHISSKKVLQYICKKSVGAFQFDHQLREHVNLQIFRYS